MFSLFSAFCSTFLWHLLVSNGQANREPARQSQVGGGNREVVVTCCIFKYHSMAYMIYCIYIYAYYIETIMDYG